MVTFLEIISGTHQGSRYRLEVGTQIGRVQGQIVLDDPKISALHAQIELDGKGQFILVDLDSSNGLVINGRRVKRVALLPGVSFEIGRTPCRVVQVQEVEAENFARIANWRTAIYEGLSLHPGHNESRDAVGKIFIPVLKLKFIQGIQSGESLTLGYGPRIFGSRTLDVELLDPEAPPYAFEISPAPGGAKIKNLSSYNILLNNQPVKNNTLSEGDVITLGNTLIKVSYA